MKKYDVVIVGAGIVGLSTAIGLTGRGLHIALIDNKAPPTELSQLDNRTTAITATSKQLLTQVGVWQCIAEDKISAYYDMHVWDAVNNAAIDFSCTEVGAENLGYILENKIIEQSLWERVKQLDEITLYTPNKPIALEVKTTHAELTLETQETLSAALIVGADGSYSWVREQCDLTGHIADYGQVAIVANCHTKESHHQTAWQRFLPTGPLAFLPLVDSHISSIVWSTTPAEGDELMHLPPAEFNQRLTAAFDSRLGAVEITSQRHIFPLKRHYAKDFVAHRVALVGDAAHSVHPLAGQGVNLGLQDATELIDTIIKATLKQRDIGALDTLRKYARARKSDTLILLTGVELLNRLFSQNNAWVAHIRGAGLRLTDKLPWVKRRMIYYALGFR
jgi:2-polyprenylphenol 6-hydroxylase